MATPRPIFPGDLPESLAGILDDQAAAHSEPHLADLRFVRFRPPQLERSASGVTLSLPHIRLDRALQFLIGDRLA